MLAYLCLCLFIGTQTRLKDGGANRIRDCFESFVHDDVYKEMCVS